jgi:hypothetical protein
MHPPGVRRISVGPSGVGESEDVASLKLELQAANASDAKERAANLLHRARRAAGLPDAIPSLAWVTPLTDDNSSSARFLEKAEELLDDEDELDMAVIAAQIHLEVQVRTLIAHTAEADGPARVEVLMNTKGLGNLNNKQVQAMIQALIGLDVTDAPEWAAYKRHNVIRNAIAHEGQDVQPEEAAAAVGAVRDLCMRLANAAMNKGLPSP